MTSTCSAAGLLTRERPATAPPLSAPLSARGAGSRPGRSTNPLAGTADHDPLRMVLPVQHLRPHRRPHADLRLRSRLSPSLVALAHGGHPAPRGQHRHDDERGHRPASSCARTGVAAGPLAACGARARRTQRGPVTRTWRAVRVPDHDGGAGASAGADWGAAMTPPLLAYLATHTGTHGGNTTGRRTPPRPVTCARCGRKGKEPHAGMCGKGVGR